MKKELRKVLIETLGYAAKGVEGIVIQYGDGSYGSCPRFAYLAYSDHDLHSKIVYSVKDLHDFGEDAGIDDIETIVDLYILPVWDAILALA